MNFARVIGTVWCTIKDPTLQGFRFRILQPEDEHGRALGEPLVAADQVSVREGDRVFFVQAREAAKAFPGKFVPVDAAIVGLVDDVEQEGAQR